MKIIREEEFGMTLDKFTGKSWSRIWPIVPVIYPYQVVQLGLNSHAEFIGELSLNANKELAIGLALNELKKRWSDVE